MPRQLFVYRKGMGVVPLEEAPASESFHAVHNDEMAPTWHPADDKVYTSKSEFRKTTAAKGYVEVGNDLLSQKKRDTKKMFEASERLKKALWDRIDNAYHSKK